MVRNVKKLGCVSQDIDPLSQSFSLIVTEDWQKILEVRPATSVHTRRLIKNSGTLRSLAGGTSAIASSPAQFLRSKIRGSLSRTGKQERWAPREAWPLAKQVHRIRGSLEFRWTGASLRHPQSNQRKNCRGFLCAHAHAVQERFELSRIWTQYEYQVARKM